MEELDGIVALLRKYLAGSLTELESERLEKWAAQHPANRALLESLSDDGSLFAGYTNYLAIYHEAVSNRLQRIEDTLLESIRPPLTEQNDLKSRLPRWLPYLAAALVATATVAWYFFDNQSGGESKIAVHQEADIAPGGSRATLTLADGRTITLDEARDGIVMGGGEITYNDGNRLTEVESKAQAMLLELSTPKGGTYQITLPDGTRVWLNAASTLRYPARFDHDERVIELEGEAYFDVVQVHNGVDSLRQPGHVSQHVPFRVLTKGQTIEVLGTEFNVSAYADDRETKTTLIEGMVRVAQPTGHQSPITIQPGQQAVTRGSLLEVSEVDVFDYTAWKDGIIVLNGARLADVVRQVERWYDVAIEVPELKTNKTAYVIINRNENLSSVLKALEATYHVKLKREGRRVGVVE